MIKCPNCLGTEHHVLKRTHFGTTYKVFVCQKCKYVSRREISDADSDDNSTFDRRYPLNHDDIHDGGIR